MESPLPAPRNNAPFTFRDLTVWKQSRALASDVYRLVSTPKLRGHYAFCDQLGRAALSVPSKIAEGDERGTNKESLRYNKDAEVKACLQRMVRSLESGLSELHHNRQAK